MPSIDMDALEDEWDDDAVVAPRGRQLASVAARARRSNETPGRVVAVDRGRIRVTLEEDPAAEQRDARYGGAMRGRRVVVGDRVRIASAERDGARIVERLERTSLLRRTGDDQDRHERIVVANADRVVIVVGADNLALGLRFADRVLVAAAAGGLAATLVVNKVDLLDADARSALRTATDPYARAVDAVLHVSTITGEGIDGLRDHLAGAWSAFTGHSGVGKSSLTNVLVPEADQDVGAIGPRGGRHTTVAAIALPLGGRPSPAGRSASDPSGDADPSAPHGADPSAPHGADASEPTVPAVPAGWLIDTPGVRSFGLGMLDRRGLAACFPELADLRCALDDCNHAGEPGCTIEAADMHPVRLAAFHRLAAALLETFDHTDPATAVIAADTPGESG